jgi:hypothetical protein
MGNHQSQAAPGEVLFDAISDRGSTPLASTIFQDGDRALLDTEHKRRKSVVILEESPGRNLCYLLVTIKPERLSSFIALILFSLRLFLKNKHVKTDVLGFLVL